MRGKIEDIKFWFLMKFDDFKEWFVKVNKLTFFLIVGIIIAVAFPLINATLIEHNNREVKREEKVVDKNNAIYNVEKYFLTQLEVKDKGEAEELINSKKNLNTSYNLIIKEAKSIDDLDARKKYVNDQIYEIEHADDKDKIALPFPIESKNPDIHELSYEKKLILVGVDGKDKNKINQANKLYQKYKDDNQYTILMFDRTDINASVNFDMLVMYYAGAVALNPKYREGFNEHNIGTYNVSVFEKGQRTFTSDDYKIE